MPIVITPELCVALIAILAASALMSGLSGFGFSADWGDLSVASAATLGVPSSCRCRPPTN